MFLKYTLLLYALLKINCVHSASTGGGVFGYPEASDGDKSKQNVLNKKPVNLPSKCQDGELLYPGDQPGEWLCDCRPGHLYHPASKRCFAAYTRGPCAGDQYIILPKRSFVPLCVKNPCLVENMVPFHGGCYRLDTAGPCPLPELNNVISVDSKTLEVKCKLGQP